MNILGDVGLPYTITDSIQDMADKLDMCKPKKIRKIIKNFKPKKINSYRIIYAVCSTKYYSDVVKGKIKRKHIAEFPVELGDLRRIINSNLELLTDKEVEKLNKKLAKFDWKAELLWS